MRLCPSRVREVVWRLREVLYGSGKFLRLREVFTAPGSFGRLATSAPGNVWALALKHTAPTTYKMKAVVPLASPGGCWEAPGSSCTAPGSFWRLREVFYGLGAAARSRVCTLRNFFYIYACGLYDLQRNQERSQTRGRLTKVCGLSPHDV